MKRGLVFGAALFIAAKVAAGPVEVRVEVAEIDHERASALGVDWSSRFSFSERAPAGLFQVGAVERLDRLRADLDLLVENGAAELLATPNLVVDPGGAAKFHAGGQIPYATSSSLGATSVEFKPYGVQLSVQPQIVSGGWVRLRVEAGVSAPDPTNAVQTAAGAVPALLERKVASTVTLRPGATLALAGLVQSKLESSTRRVPVLGRIPFLGRLFRWERRREHKTTVIVFVTPRPLPS